MLLAWFTGILLLGINVAAEKSLRNNNLIRDVDISNHNVREIISIAVENVAEANSGIKAPLYDVYVPWGDKLAYIKAIDRKSDQNLTVNFIEKTSRGDKFQVHFDTALNPGERKVIKILIVYHGALSPLPKEIALGEKQYIFVDVNQHFWSPYPSAKEKSTITLPKNSAIESFTQAESVVLNSEKDKIICGPFIEVKSFSEKRVAVHYENRNAFLTVRSLVRTLTLSHWSGDIAVKEDYHIEHTGAKLKGQFSRIDYTKIQQKATSVVQSMTVLLPAQAHDLYYVDEVGNVSTSTVIHELERTVFFIRPRFPLFGGWENKWTHGYKIPMSSAVKAFSKEAGSVNIIRFPFIHTLGDANVDNIRVKIIFPEGASDINLLQPPYAVNQSRSVEYGYLDTVGRPCLTLEKNNVIPEHEQYFQISYKYEEWMNIQEPFLLFLLIMTGFIAAVIYQRIPSAYPQKVSVDSLKKKS